MRAISKLMFAATLLQSDKCLYSRVARGYSTLHMHTLAQLYRVSALYASFSLCVSIRLSPTQSDEMHKLTDTKVNFPFGRSNIPFSPLANNADKDARFEGNRSNCNISKEILGSLARNAGIIIIACRGQNRIDGIGSEGKRIRVAHLDDSHSVAIQMQYHRLSE